MKKFWKYLAACAIAGAMLPMVACSDNDEVDPYTLNYCYLFQPNSTFARVEYKANGDLMGDLADPWQLMPVRLTKPAPHDMNIQIAFDPSLVAEYNEAHGTDYVYLEGAEVVTPVMHIARGEYISPDSIKIGFSNHSGFLTGQENLILPVVISNADGAVISKSSRIFLTFNSTYDPLIVEMAKPSATVAANTRMDGWESMVSTITLKGAIAINYSPYETLTANVKFDQSLVAEYNEAHGTDFKFKPDAKFVESPVKINEGDEAGNIVINFGDLTDFANGQGYVLPVVITSVEGCEAELNPQAYTTYVVVRPVGDEITITEDDSEITGPEFSFPADATVSVNGSETYGYYTWRDILNPDSYAYGYMKPDVVMDIDFGEVVTLSAFYVDMYYASYGATSIKLMTSEDNVNWTEWEELSWTERIAHPYFKLAYPAQVRYMKIQYPTARSSYYGTEVDGMRFYGD